MQKTEDAPRVAPRLSMSGGLGRPKRVQSDDGLELQTGKLVGHKIQCLACASAAGDEVPHEGDYSHVKLNVVMLKVEERHRNPETGDYQARPSQLKGDTLKVIQKLKLEAPGLKLVLEPKDGKIEVIVPKDQLTLPAEAKLDLQYASIVKSFTAKECDWFAGDYNATLDFGGQEAKGCCVIS